MYAISMKHPSPQPRLRSPKSSAHRPSSTPQCPKCGADYPEGAYKFLAFPHELPENASSVDRWLDDELVMAPRREGTCSSCGEVTLTLELRFETLRWLSAGNPGLAEVLDEEKEMSDDADYRQAVEKSRRKGQLIFATVPFAAIVGDGEMLRPLAVSRFWDYVKDKGLQKEEHELKTYIYADDYLYRVFGKKKVLLSEIPDLLDRHLRSAD